MGWIFLILILKCKRARAKRLAEEQAAIAAQPCHVIQIGSNYYDIIPVSSNHNFSNYRSCTSTNCNLQQQQVADSNNNITTSSNPSSISAPPTSHSNVRTHTRRSSHITHTNQAFIMDEGGIFPSTTTCDLPPSYDDVMRLPTSYPKVAPSPFTPSYDEIMQSEYERNARNLNNNNNGPAIIQVSSSSVTTASNQIRSQERPLTTNNNVTTNNSNNEVV